MRHIPFVWTFVLWLGLWLGPITGLASEADDPSAVTDFRQDRVIVKIAPNASIEAVRTRHGGRVLGQLLGTADFSIEVPAGVDVAAMVEALRSDVDVVMAEPDFILQSPEARQTTMAFVDHDSPPFIDNESPPRYYSQTAYDQVLGPAAHWFSTGRGVIIAVIDTGVSFSHPALVGRFSPSRYDFVDNDDDPTDVPGGMSSGHGTFVSGIIALLAPDARVMPLRALGTDGRGAAFDIARAIRFAVNNGAQVINMSFGMWVDSTFVREAVEYAVARGVLCVAASGNDNTQRDSQFPANHASVIGVAAVNGGDQKAWFSNYGGYIKAAAPGEDIYSTFLNDGFASWSGTSFAVPFVVAEAALIWARFPYLRREGVEARLLSTTDDISRNLIGLYRRKLGSGRVNLLASLQDAE